MPYQPSLWIYQLFPFCFFFFFGGVILLTFRLIPIPSTHPFPVSGGFSLASLSNFPFGFLLNSLIPLWTRVRRFHKRDIEWSADKMSNLYHDKGVITVENWARKLRCKGSKDEICESDQMALIVQAASASAQSAYHVFKSGLSHFQRPAPNIFGCRFCAFLLHKLIIDVICLCSYGACTLKEYAFSFAQAKQA